AYPTAANAGVRALSGGAGLDLPIDLRASGGSGVFVGYRFAQGAVFGRDRLGTCPQTGPGQFVSGTKRHRQRQVRGSGSRTGPSAPRGGGGATRRGERTRSCAGSG